MRKFMLLILFVVMIVGCQGFTSAEVNPVDNFNVVKNVDGVKKDDIYNKIYKYIATNFKSAKAVVDYANQNDGSITANIMMPSYWEHPTADKVPMHVMVKFIISIKDEKFKIDIISVQLNNDNCMPSEYGRCDSNTFYSIGQRDRFYEDIDVLLNDIVKFIKSDDKSW